MKIQYALNFDRDLFSDTLQILKPCISESKGWSHQRTSGGNWQYLLVMSKSVPRHWGAAQGLPVAKRPASVF